MAPRSAQSGSTAAITSILQSIASKRSDYKDGIGVNHMLCKTAAERLALGGDLETTLFPMANGNDSEHNDNSVISQDEIRDFFSKQRNRLKKLSERNVIRERSIDTFVAAITTLSGQVASSDGQEDAYNENTDFTTVVQDLMNEESSRRKETELDLVDEEYCRQVRQKLGEKEKPRNNRNDEEEIEVVRNNTSSSTSLKCPITGMLMNDPVKNKICGHVYSREGITHHLQSRGTGRGRRKVSCPVAGCTNSDLTEEQLEDDVETAMLVRRQRRREDMENEHRIKSQEDMLEEELEMM